MLSFLTACIVSFSLYTSSYTSQPVEIVQEVPILMYHEIGDPDGPWESLYVSEASFRNQMEYLKSNGYNTITLRDLQKNREGLRRLPPKPIVITFDDGYSSMYSLVYNLFKETGMKGVFYIYPKKFGSWNSLTEEEIKEMSDNGMEIGSHSMSHLNMHKMNKNQLKYEVEESKKILEDITNRPIESFCYPAGRLSESLIEELINAGYTNAVTTKYGIYSHDDNIYKIKRIRINYSDSLNVFINRISN
jgi:peptidoglycan/xylan/chitin deacetylase (PgdA/CDA1 family)